MGVRTLQRGILRDFELVTATIPAGGYLSAVVDIGPGRLIRALLMPAAWTAAEMRFQASADGVTFDYWYSTTEGILGLTPGAGQLIPLEVRRYWGGVRYLKLHSGTVTTPVNQAADRVITLVLQAGRPRRHSPELRPVFRARDVLTATIGSGQSLSGAVELRGMTPLAVLMPSGWTAADLSFQGSVDGSQFSDLWGASSEETVKAAASLFIPLDSERYACCRYLKVRSGASGAPVTQGADRTIQIVCA